MTTSAQPHDGGPQRFVLDPRGPATFQADQPAGGTVPYVLDCAACTISRWTADAVHQGGALLRPTVGHETGFAYSASASGQSGHTEPTWPTTVGDTVIDGSLTLTAVASAAAAGGDIVSDASWTVTAGDGEFVITDITFDDSTTSAFIGGGTSGVVYSIAVVISMASGAVYVASIEVTVL